MAERTEAALYLVKAEESLIGAVSEYANGRYNNCANRCYYARFQAAVAGLLQAGLRPTSREGQWSHSAVQAQFAGQLIGRRKVYAAELGDALTRLFALRRTADYETNAVSEIQAARALRRARLRRGSPHDDRRPPMSESMFPDVPPLSDPRYRRAVTELQERILASFPEATFRVTPGEEPGTVFLYATVDLDDPEPVLDATVDRILELLVEEQLPIYVIPMRTPEREAALREQRVARPATAVIS